MTQVAAIVPYVAGYCGVLVASGDELPLAYVSAESFEVGRLSALAEPLPGKTMRRDLDDASLAQLCQQVHAALHGATRVYLLASSAQLATRVVAALFAFLPTCGAETTIVASSAGFVANAFYGWNPPDRGRTVFERCAGMLISQMGGWKRDTGRDRGASPCETIGNSTSQGGTGRLVTVSVGTGRSGEGREGELPVDDDGSGSERADPRSVEAEPGRHQGGIDNGRDRSVVVSLPSGSVTAALDPGSSYLGLAIVQGTGPIHLTLAQTFDVGETVVEKNGKAHHVVNDASLDALADRVVALLLEFGVTDALVEHVDSVHISPGQANAASSISTALIRTMMVGTTMRERLRAAGITVTRVRASTWRARVGARGKRGESELELLPQVIAASIVNWDEWHGDVDEHGRDAIGLAIYGTLPATSPGSRMGRKSAKVDTEQEKLDRLARGVVNKRAQRKRDREAKGCFCPITDERRVHGSECPIRVEQLAKMRMPRGKYKKTLVREGAA